MAGRLIWDQKVAGSSPAAPTKPCIRCGQAKPLSDFYQHPTARDGHAGTCKKCILGAAKSRKLHRLNSRTADGMRELEELREVVKALPPVELQRGMIKLELMKRYLVRMCSRLDGRKECNKSMVTRAQRHAFACALRRITGIQIEP